MAKTPPPPPPPPTVDPQETGTTDTPDTPPRRTRKSATGATGATGPTARKPPLQKRLEEFFAVPAAIEAAAGHQYPAQIIALRSPELAENLYLLSRENPAVKRVLERMLEGGAWGGVILSAASIIFPVAMYHRGTPADPFAMIYPAPQVDERQPIVPPPPSPQRDTDGDGAPASSGAGGRGANMTPPLKPDQPPGVVTVAGSNAGHR